MLKHRDDNEFLPRYERVRRIRIPKSKYGTLIALPNDEGILLMWDFGIMHDFIKSFSSYYLKQWDID